MKHFFLIKKKQHQRMHKKMIFENNEIDSCAWIKVWTNQNLKNAILTKFESKYEKFDVFIFCCMIECWWKKKWKRNWKKMKKIFILLNFFISWFANENVCHFFAIWNHWINDFFFICVWICCFFSFVAMKFRHFFLNVLKCRIFSKTKRWICIAKKRIDCFQKFIRSRTKISSHFTDCAKWNLMFIKKEWIKKSDNDNLIDLNEFRLRKKLLFFRMFVLSCFNLLLSSAKKKERWCDR